MAIIGTWFLFPFIIPEPQIEQLCVDIIFIGRQCISDPNSIITYPQRLFNWYVSRVIAVVTVGLIGVFSILWASGGSKK